MGAPLTVVLCLPMYEAMTDLQLSDLREGDLDVLALEGVPRLGELPQLVRVLVEPLLLHARRFVVEGVDEDGRQVALGSKEGID